LASLNIY